MAKRSHAHFCADALSIDLHARLGVAPDFADVAVCNPPFISPKWRKSFPEILRRVGLPIPDPALELPADVLFLAQNLWVLKSKGQLGIIVPAGIINGSKSRRVRDALLERHCVSEVVELPPNAFIGTEVRSYILYLRKDAQSAHPVRLLKCDSAGVVDRQISISAEEASERLDYSFYQWRRNAMQIAPQATKTPLTVIRGNVGMSEARARRWPVVHTTDIPSEVHGSRLELSIGRSVPQTLSSRVHAVKGDVLIARVGRHLEQKVALVMEGTAPISDCVYIVRSSEQDPESLWNSLSSRKGREWIAAHAHGACAQFLTKADLMKFNI